MKWYTSDLHWFHRNIVKYTDRSKAKLGNVFVNEENHNKWLINLWNNQVQPGDLVYHMGDFSFAKDVKKTIEVLDRLNGQIFMIKGNHDHSDAMRVISAHHKVVALEHYKEIKIGDNNACLFHFPMAIWHRQHHGAFHLHGHSHGNYTEGKGRILDVGLDSAYNIFGVHKFFSEEDVLEYMKHRPVVVGDHHTVRERDM